MNLDELPPETKVKIDELKAAVEEALKSKPSPHIKAVSESSMPDGPRPTDALVGGTIRAPAKPPFLYDKRKIGELHRSVLQSGKGELFGVIFRAERANISADWVLQTKAISRKEHEEITQARQQIDKEVERVLRQVSTFPPLEWISFGRDQTQKEPIIHKKGPSGVEKQSANPQLLELLSQTEELYRAKNLELVIASWTVGENGIEFREYLE